MRKGKGRGRGICTNGTGRDICGREDKESESGGGDNQQRYICAAEMSYKSF